MIALGHPPDAVWGYTPRQLAAYLFIANRRRKRELSEQLAINALAAQGDGEALKRQMRELEE